MAARILKLPVERMRGRAPRSIGVGNPLAGHADRLHFWHGASGRSYPHTVYGLLECPPVPAATYVMVKRAGSGAAKALRIGRVLHAADTLNLAELRRVAATLGAGEIHLHFLAEGDTGALAVELDLKSASQDDLPAASLRAAR